MRPYRLPALPGLRPRRDAGFAFVMTLLAAVMVAGIATTMAVVSATESMVAMNQITHMQTVYLAEAGVQHALWQLAQDPTNMTPVVAQGLGVGKYDVIISALDWGRFRLLARGRTESTFGTGLSTDVAVFPQALNYAIATNNYDNDFTGIIVDGVISPTTIPVITIDYPALLAEADWVIPGNQTFSSDFSYSGVIYVDGDIKFQCNCVWVEGTIVATGNIVVEVSDGYMVNGYAHFASAPGMPALVSGHDLQLGKGGQRCQISVRGLAFADHNLDLKEDSDFYIGGSLVGLSRVQIQNDCSSVEIHWDPGLRTRPPLGVLQAADQYSWSLVPATRETITDMSPFESL
jgi:hypothetical protein